MAADLADLERDQNMTKEALRLLESRSPDTYSRALAALREDTRQWWEEQLTWEADVSILSSTASSTVGASRTCGSTNNGAPAAGRCKQNDRKRGMKPIH